MTITLFTILKSFDDPHIATIQRNALRSWQQMQPAPEIFAFGDKSGAKDICEELGIKHMSRIATNEAGLEKVSSAFSRAWKQAAFETLCYVNADMILPPTFPYVVASINAESFLMVGQRHNTPITDLIDFAPGWWSRVKSQALTTGHRHTVNGIDYFVHRRNAFEPLPELVVGRWYWDNYMIARAKTDGIPVIDATEAVLAIHQDHDYRHFPGGLGALGAGEESMSNMRHLPGGVVQTIADADVRLLLAF